MNKRYVHTLLLFAGISCALWAACTTQRDPCLTPTTVGLNVEAVHYVTDSLVADTILPAAVFIAETPSGLVEIVDTLTSSTFTLSLSPVDTICRYMVATDTLPGSLYDTLTLTYARNLTFLSNACGFTYFYTLNTIHCSHFNIDSAVIANASVTSNVNTEHVKIYVHPD